MKHFFFILMLSASAFNGFCHVQTETLIEDFESYNAGEKIVESGNWYNNYTSCHSVISDAGTPFGKVVRSSSCATGNGGYLDYSFPFTANSESYIRYQGRITTGSGDNCHASLFIKGNNETFGFGFMCNPSLGVNYKPFVYNSDGLQYGDALSAGIWYDFKLEIDWSYKDSQGKYGKATMLYKETTLENWKTLLNDIELHISDPSQFKQLQVRLDGIGNKLGEVDNIYYSNDLSQNSESRTTEKLYPVFKYHLTQDGTQGLVFASKFLSVATTISTEVGFNIIKGLIKEYIKDEIIEFSIETILGIDEEPKFVTCCMKYDGNNLSTTNSNFVFLVETNQSTDEIKVGEPFEATYEKYNYQGENTLVPPGIGLLVENTYKSLTRPENFYTVYEAGQEMHPKLPKSRKYFPISTVGIVNGYVSVDGKRYMILQNYQPLNISFTTIIALEFVAIDITNESQTPAIGSLIEVIGNVKDVQNNFTIKQSYEWWYSEEVCQYIKPTDISLINGEYDNNLIFNTSLFSIFQNGECKVVALNFPNKSDLFPDFKFEEKNVTISPNKFIENGKSYILKATITNSGSIEGNCKVIAYGTNSGQCFEIGNIEINSLKPGDTQLIEIPWIPDEQIDIANGNTKVNFSISNSTPYELITNNNTISKEANIDIGFLNILYGIKELFVLTSYCPVSLKVTTPSGQIVDINNNNIPNAEYIVDDFDDDGILDTRIVLPELDEGEYKIEVIPTDEATADDTYTLELRINDEQIDLAKDVKISEIPTTNYSYVITSSKTIPTEEDLKVSFNNDVLIINPININANELFVEIFDLSGKILYSKKHSVTGHNPIKINSQLIRGVNIVRVSNEKINKSCLIIEPR